MPDGARMMMMILGGMVLAMALFMVRPPSLRPRPTTTKQQLTNVRLQVFLYYKYKVFFYIA